MSRLSAEQVLQACSVPEPAAGGQEALAAPMQVV